jgi:DNA-binding beta-propeller fold protein YncE
MNETPGPARGREWEGAKGHSEHKGKTTLTIATLLAALVGVALGVVVLPVRPAVADPVGSVNEGSHEVWVIDQSDTTADGGGTLYIYTGEFLAGAAAPNAVPEVIDLGGAARNRCLAQTGTAPRRPHMIEMNAAHSHAIIAFVATGQVLFMDAATRTPLTCVDVGLQVHAAMPTPDQRYVVVANQNGKLLQRIKTDYGANAFQLEDGATLDLANGTTPSGAPRQDPSLRPDNAPICPIIESASRFAFVTLRGGGLFVVDVTATPMAIVAEYDQDTVHPNGCGGAEATGKIYINSGGGTAANPLEPDLYAFPLGAYSATPSPPNTPAPVLGLQPRRPRICRLARGRSHQGWTLSLDRGPGRQPRHGRGHDH